jgi:hypothetical protein
MMSANMANLLDAVVLGFLAKGAFHLHLCILGSGSMLDRKQDAFQACPSQHSSVAFPPMQPTAHISGSRGCGRLRISIHKHE